MRPAKMISLHPPHLSFDWRGALPPIENAPAVFRMRMRSGEPYLSRTTVLQRRLNRLLGERAPTSRLLDLRHIAASLEIWYTPTRLEQALTFYWAARETFPATYPKIIRLPAPPYLKILLANPFPRTQITSRLAGRDNLFYGPFRARSEADRWQSDFLDFFQIRRCEEDLSPHPDHPGCIYGEMNQCLRPCQAAVGIAEYASEVKRLTAFLESDGESLKDSIAHARDRASAGMEFEEAARQHRRFEKADSLLRTPSEITGDIRRANGVSAIKSGTGVELYFLLDGCWQTPVPFDMATQAGESMDRRLRQAVESLKPTASTLSEKQEQLALLARWFFSDSRDTEWLPFPSLSQIPYRKLVRLISRAMTPVQPHANITVNAEQDHA